MKLAEREVMTAHGAAAQVIVAFAQKSPGKETCLAYSK
jgi:hypothetical protein